MVERETLENHVHVTDNYSPDNCCWTELDGTVCGVDLYDKPDEPQCGEPEFALTYGVAALVITAIIIWVLTRR